MANYVVTTRGKDGSLVDRAYAANDRADLFKKLAADGVTSVRVREGTLGKKPRKSVAGGAPSKGRGLIAAAIVILGVGAAVWYLMPSGEKKPNAGRKVQKKVEVKKAVPPSTKPIEVKKDDDFQGRKGMVLVRGKWYPEYDEKGGRIWVTRTKVKYHTPVVYTNTSNRTRLSRAARIFKDTVDQDIADLICAPVGATWIGDVKYSKRFVKRFLKSLERPIIVTAEDDEYTKSVKEAVVQTKIDLKARHDAGEDIAQIMTDTRRELQKLGAYKADLEQLTRTEIRKIKNDAEAQKLLYEAANKMLEQRGISPMRMPGILYRKVKINTSNKSDVK